MLKVRDIAACLEGLAPSSAACPWDNVGLIVGDMGAEVKKILVALDASFAVAEEAVKFGVDLIVTHHPVIFGGLKEIVTTTGRGRTFYTLIQNGVSVYSAHTNLDAADGGTNDALFEALNLREKETLLIDGAALARAGVLIKDLPLSEFSEFVKKTLGTDIINFAGDPDKMVRKTAVAAGAASGRKYFVEAAKAGCDCYVTGDVSYHDAQDALDLGLGVIDAGHFATEAPVVGALCRYLERVARENGWALEVFPSEQKDIFNRVGGGR